MLRNNYKRLSDIDLLSLVVKDDRLAFAEIYSRYWQALYKYAYKVCPDEMLCEDMVQEVFISLYYKNRETRIVHLESYLIKAVKYKVLNQLRKREFTDLQQRYIELIPEKEESQELEYQELLALTHRSINQLPPRCRQVFKMSREQGLSHAQIAAELSLSVRTIEKHISNAIAALRHLNEFSIWCAFILINY